MTLTQGQHSWRALTHVTRGRQSGRPSEHQSVTLVDEVALASHGADWQVRAPGYGSGGLGQGIGEKPDPHSHFLRTVVPCST